MNERKKKKFIKNIFNIIIISMLFFLILFIADLLWNISETLVTSIYKLWSAYTIMIVIIVCITESVISKR